MASNRLARWCTSTVTIAPFSSLDAGGAASYGTAVSYPAWVERTTTLVKDQTGREVLSTTQLYLAPSSGSLPGVTVKDRVTLDDGTVPTVLAVEKLPTDAVELDHEVVFCG